jgi:hypothetical protein
MAAPKYISQLPTEKANPATFTFINYNLIAPKVEAMAHGLNTPQLRQLLALWMATEQRRRLYIGVAQWFRNSPSSGHSYIKRKHYFFADMEILLTGEFIEITPVARGRVARLTLKGEQLCNEVNQYLYNYYTSIFSQFNLIPVL